MRDGRCPHCAETARLAGKPRDFLPSANDIDDLTRRERHAMTATQQRGPEAPTMIPGPVNGWTGKYKACRDCGRRNEMEIEDGICLSCYREQYGPAGLRMAGARREAAPKATLTAVSAPPAPPPTVTAQSATARPWHPDYPDGCVNCGTTEKSYQSRGLCGSCGPLSRKPGYTGKIGRKKVRVGREWVWEDEAAQAEAARIAGDLERIGAPLDDDGKVRLREVCADRAAPSTFADVPPIPPPAPPAPLPDPPAAPAASAPLAEPRVPAVVASAVVAQVQVLTAPLPDPADIPLADLLAAVTRLVNNLATRLIAAEGRAEAAEGDAAKYRRIVAVIGREGEGE